MEDDDKDDMARREWERMKESSEKLGFREGVGAGTEEGLQKGFDDGYNIALSVSKFYNVIRGRLAVKSYLSDESIAQKEKSTKLSSTSKSTKDSDVENPPGVESTFAENDVLVTSEKTVLRYIEEHFYTSDNVTQRTEKHQNALHWIDLAGERTVIDKWI